MGDQKPTPPDAGLAFLEDGARLAEGMLRMLSGQPPLAAGHEESPVAPYQHLVRRAHPWRRQLFLKGRNLTVRQLVGTMRANDLSEAQATTEFDLPIEAIREALAYYADNVELIELETAWERFLLAQRRRTGGAQPVS